MASCSRLPTLAGLSALLLTSCATEAESPQDAPTIMDGATEEAEAGSQLQDEAEIPETAEGFKELHDRLSGLPGETRALVIEDGEPLVTVGDGGPAPLASVAKLYVTFALAEAVETGEVDWHETVEITEDLRSLPSGTLQDQQEGYETTVYDVAQRMVQISDNTGTDMLIDLLGRETVESAVADSGHHDPSLLRPFLTTREMFQLRWGFPDLGADWDGAGEQERRSILEEVGDEGLEITSEDVDGDDVDFSVDWHASTEDLHALYELLFARMQEQAELETVLTSNPGLTFAGFESDDLWWDTLAFKGGILPGVVNGLWHAAQEDGSSRTVAVMTQHEDAEELREHSEEIFALAEDALTLQAP